MSKKTQSFKKTGKNVNVSRDDLINATTEKLAQYDSLLPGQKKGVPCPYQNPVYVKTSDNKMVQVPRYIQNLAIMKWKSCKLSSHVRMDKRKNSSHTRIDRRTRGAGHDPYVMNDELKNARDRENDYYKNSRNMEDLQITGIEDDASADSSLVDEDNSHDYRLASLVNESMGDVNKSVNHYKPYVHSDKKYIPRETDYVDCNISSENHNEHNNRDGYHDKDLDGYYDKDLDEDWDEDWDEDRGEDRDEDRDENRDKDRARGHYEGDQYEGEYDIEHARDYYEGEDNLYAHDSKDNLNKHESKDNMSEMVEGMDARFSHDNTYKYLFFLLLIVVLILFYGRGSKSLGL